MSGVSYPSTDESIVMLCPRQMVGRVIGRSGETIRAIQLYTNATISINQRYDPSLVIIHGGNASVALASQMVDDIIKGRFKGFALLRQAAARGSDNLRELVTYVPTKGFLPKKRDVQQHPCEIPTNVNLAGLANMQHLMQNELYASAQLSPQQLSPQQFSPTKVNTCEIKAYTTELLAIQYMQKQLEQKKQSLLGKVISGDDHSFTSSQSSLPALPAFDVPNTPLTAPPTSAAANAAHLLPRYLLESLNDYNLE